MRNDYYGSQASHQAQVVSYEIICEIPCELRHKILSRREVHGRRPWKDGTHKDQGGMKRYCQEEAGMGLLKGNCARKSRMTIKMIDISL